MFVLIGWVVVIVAVIGSFLFEGGHILALLQPFELMCIFGAALGAFVVSNPPKVIKAVLKALPTCFGSKSFGKDKYLQLIALLFELLQKSRQEGFLALETDVNDPAASPIFAKYPAVKDDAHLTEFIVDYLRMMLSGNLNVLEIQELMDAELETHHAEKAVPAAAIQRMADALPAYGIVAAVMGVVHTMGSVGQPPKVLGEMVAAALVGTFLGILLGYGFIGPLASVLEANAIEQAKPFECVKTVLLASMSGYSPTIAVEFGRKVLFSVDRPSFQELEDTVKATKNPASAPGAGAEAAAAAPAPA
jgi:chemotaxis protein MotA